MFLKEMPLEDFQTMVDPLESANRYSFDPRIKGRFVFNEDKIRFELNGSQYRITPESYTKLGQMIGIPGTYISKTPHAMMVPHVNYWLANKDMSQMSFSVVDDVIRSFSKGGADPISNNLILEKAAEIAGSAVQLHHVSHDEFSTQYSILSESLETAVEVGDVVRVGVSISNSYALASPLSIATYVHRLVCTNGAISSDNVFRYTRKTGGSDDQADWIDEALKTALEAADQEVDRLRNMKLYDVKDHLSEAVTSLFAEFGVPQQLRQAVMDQVLDNDTITLYDLYNAITWVGSNSVEAAEDPTLASRMMRIGGRLAAHPERCDNCFRFMA